MWRLIDEDDVIDALWQAEKELPYYDSAQVTVNVIKDLPSAQPEIIRCRDCKHRDTDDCTMRFVERIEWDDDGYTEYDDVVTQLQQRQEHRLLWNPQNCTVGFALSAEEGCHRSQVSVRAEMRGEHR